uniref:Methylosome subunit pICln n=1 Tax=Rhabditophanes sp. KR3021 TaxID=114890 RepID=A0AC35UHM6_9BILA
MGINIHKIAVPTEGVRQVEENVVLFEDKNNIGVGTLYICEHVILWQLLGTETGIEFDYKALNIHAVSSDFTVFPEICLLLMIDGTLTNFYELSEEEIETNTNYPTLILRFVYQDGNVYDGYNMLSECQALNPDEDDMQNGDDSEWITADTDNVEHMN